MKIQHIETAAALAALVAELMKQGVTFQAYPTPDGRWTVELTGGY